MRYGEGLLEEILTRTDLVQLVGRRIKLDRKGRVFWGLCPFHKEKSPSFKVENVATVGGDICMELMGAMRAPPSSRKTRRAASLADLP